MKYQRNTGKQRQKHHVTSKTHRRRTHIKEAETGNPHDSFEILTTLIFNYCQQSL